MGDVSQSTEVEDRGPSPFDRPEASPRGRIPILGFLDRVFLWLPNETKPGVWAVGLVLLRQATLPWIVMLTPAVALALASPGLLDRVRQNRMPGWSGMAAAILAFGSIALVEGLSRYAFVRRASQRGRAIVIFTAVIVAAELLISHGRLYTMVWMTASEVLASVALYESLRRRLAPGVIVPAIIAAQTAIYVVAPQFFMLPVVQGAH